MKGVAQLHDFGTITIKKEIENSDSGVFELVLITEDNVRAAEIANVEIKIELVK